jgi:hypothetical protein
MGSTLVLAILSDSLNHLLLCLSICVDVLLFFNILGP